MGKTGYIMLNYIEAKKLIPKNKTSIENKSM